MVGNHHLTQFENFFGQQRAKIWPMCPKRKLDLNNHPTSVHHKFELELDCENTFSDNGRKPPFRLIFGKKMWPLRCQNWANIAQQQINSEHSPNKCIHKIWNWLSDYISR